MSITFILLIVGGILIYQSNKKVAYLKTRLDLFEKVVDRLKLEIEVLTLKVAKIDKNDNTEEPPSIKEAPVEEAVEEKQKVIQHDTVLPEPLLNNEIDDVKPDLPPDTDKSKKHRIDIPIFSTKVIEKQKKRPPKKSEWRVKWDKFKANVDWEQFTGIKLFAWLSGIALFIGMGFFVKYSIDKNLIPPSVRLIIAAITGIGLIGASWRFSKERYEIMRQAFTAGGIGVLYSVVFASTLYYRYLPELVGFTLLSIVSIAAFVLAVHHRAVAISVLGALGAYASPILVNTWHNNLVLMFIYLAIVNIGLFQVVRRLESHLLLLLSVVGTLITLTFGSFEVQALMHPVVISFVWIANLTLFSAFIWKLNADPVTNKYISWAGNILYAYVLIVSLMLLNRPGSALMLLLNAGMAGVFVLTLRNNGWHARVIPYAVLSFIVSFIWSFKWFDPSGMSPDFILVLLFGASGGLGPILLMRKFGIVKSSLQWLKSFPIAMLLLCITLLVKNPVVSFWFWPLIVSLQLVGVFVSLLVGAIFQMGLLAIISIAGGLYWITQTPAHMIGLGFYAFLLAAAILVCTISLFAISKLPDLINYFKLDTHSRVPLDKDKGITEWMVAAPAIGAFAMLAVTFWSQRPVMPHPGMATVICFLFLALFLSKRLSFQPLGVVALLSAVFAQTFWVLNPSVMTSQYYTVFFWSAALFIASLMVPFIWFRSKENWEKVWMAWGVFELIQGLFVIWACDHLWIRMFSGWMALNLAVLKLPVIYFLLKQLKDSLSRNKILAVHGGALLFYVSLIPVLMLDKGWMGLCLVFEASALLWLNRRITHPGLRWVSSFMAPIGLFLLIIDVPHMKGPDSMKIINAAVLSVTASILALSASIKNAGFPDRKLGRIHLPNYFLWLAVGTGFYLINLIVSDMFATSGIGFKVFPGVDFLQAVIYCFAWVLFGACLWSVKIIHISMRVFGMLLIGLGSFLLVSVPFIMPYAISVMKPLVNLGIVAYLPVILILLYLFIREPRETGQGMVKNLFLLMLLATSFMFLKVENSTVFQSGMKLSLFSEHTLSMMVASAFGWLCYGLGLLIWPKHLDRSFRLAGLVLLFFGLIKAAFIPINQSAAFGLMPPLLNSPSLIYLVILIMLTGLALKMPERLWPVSQLPMRPFWGVTLAMMAFYVLNVEISSVFSKPGQAFSFLTHGHLSHQLAYSLSWMLFATGLLITGIKLDIVKVRWASLVLLVITSFKIFFMDLWKLGQLYRVASFVGLAAVLMLVSFLYQKFLSGRLKNEK